MSVTLLVFDEALFSYSLSLFASSVFQNSYVLATINNNSTVMSTVRHEGRCRLDELSTILLVASEFNFVLVI